MSKELIEKAKTILSTIEVPERHTYFQVEKFIIGKEPTPMAQLWQIIKEVKVRMDTVDSLELQLAEQQDTIEHLQVQLEMGSWELKKLAEDDATEPEVQQFAIRMKEIEIRRLERKKHSAEQGLNKLAVKLKYTLEEISCLVNGYDKIVAMVGEVKPIDDLQSQREMWNQKLLQQFNLKILLKSPLDSELITTILALDDESPVKQHVVAILQKVQEQMILERERQLAAQTAPATGQIKPHVEPKPRVISNKHD